MKSSACLPVFVRSWSDEQSGSYVAINASSTEISHVLKIFLEPFLQSHTRNIQQLPCAGGCSAEEKQSAFLE